MAVPYTFGTATAAIPLSQLDSNFATAITIGNTAVQLGNTVTTLNNMTLANVTISSGNVTITNVAITTANVSGTANISTLVVTANASVAGNVTVSGNTVVTGNVTSATHILTGGTANGVVYLDTTKALTTGSALTFDGTNLGIGLASPGCKVDVLAASNTSLSPTVRVYSNNLAVNTAISYDGIQGSGDFYIGSTSNSPVIFKQSNTEQMRLTSTGLGIGTSSPAAKFEVSTGAATKMRLTSTADNNADIDFYTNSVQRGIIEFNSVGGLIYTVPSLPLTFGTNNTERARIDSSGNLLVGTTSFGQPDVNAGAIGKADGAFRSHHATGTASGTIHAYFTYGGLGIGSITQNGTTGVLYNLTSDYRLKNDQQALTGAKDFIMALKPKKWQWWDGSGEGVGFVAHEFMEVAKHSGNGEKDAVDADGKPVYQSIQPSSSEVMANLVAFIQEQQAIIQSLTASITALEGA